MWPYVQMWFPLLTIALNGCDLLQRSLIHHGTVKASGISSWYSCRTDRFQTICSKRRNSVFGALGPIRACESSLKPWAMWLCFAGSAFQLEKSRQRICKMVRG
jgi:hypothetical protein